ncbi:FAD-binding protein, partial [Vibrio breoganii]
MPHSNHFDVIVIGSGPGGEGAAMGLTKAGLNVAIIEKESSV